MKTRFVTGKLKILVILFVIAAPIFWYWFWGWGTLHIIDFSAQDVEYVNISCSHLRKIGTVRDPEEIQALIDEANSMQNRGTSLKKTDPRHLSGRRRLIRPRFLSHRRD